MAAKRIDIMDIRQIIQLKIQGESNRNCSIKLGIHRNTVNYYVRQLKATNTSFSDLQLLSDTQLKDLFPSRSLSNEDRYEELSQYFPYFKKQMHLPGATREVLWKEYLQKHPEGYGYTQFNEHYNSWLGQTKASGKLTHVAGDQLFIDYCGKKLHITDRETGELIDVEVFVGILPCSNYTYFEASYTQKKGDLIKSLVNCLNFFNGCSKTLTPDNLKAAVSKASKYEPVLNKTLKDFALHYNAVINPTRSRMPQDKALVESAVRFIYQRVYFPMRHMVFFSLDQLNEYLQSQVVKYNEYVMDTYQASRRKLFVDIEQPYLQPLPSESYQIKNYKRAKVQNMGYIYLSDSKNYYSVPYRFIKKQVEVQYNDDIVEIFYSTQRIASHQRSHRPGNYQTIKDHLSSTHQFYNDWNPEFFRKLALNIGSHTADYISKLIEQKDYPEVGYKQALGIIALKKGFDCNRIEKACSLAITHHRYSYRTIKRILENNMDKTLANETKELLIPVHSNIRGAKFYN